MATTGSSLISEIMRRRARQRGFIARLLGGDEISRLVTLACAVLILLIVVLIIWELAFNSGPAINKFHLWGFLKGRTWNVSEDRPELSQLGALPFIYGTCVTSLLAMLIAVPLGVASAVFLSEMAPPKISNFFTFLIELLAAVPSVIYGLIGIFIVIPMITKFLVPGLRSTLGFLPFFQGPFRGSSFLSAGIVLSVMVVPFIVSVSREVLLAVPVEQREAAMALGATKWETTWDIVLPYARTGIFGSVFLALARALGETMAVTMVVGNVPKITASLFSSGYSVAAVIANEFANANGKYHSSALILMGLVLFGLTIVINAVARILILATQQRGS